MILDLNGAIAIVALMWTIYQQYSISKLCSECPIRKAAIEQTQKIKKR